MLRKLLHEVDEAVFPSGIYCVSCGALIDRSRMYSLCDDCIQRFHWITGRTCEKCGKAMPDTSKGRLCYDCMQEEHYFTKGFSCLTYGLHERELMMDLKYAGKGYLARIFGDVMFDRMEMEIREGLKIDIIAPVPVSQGRLRKRGYNQSAIMARQLARRWKEYVRENQTNSSTNNERSRCGPHPPTEMPEQAVGTLERAAESNKLLYPAPVCRTDLLCRTRETRMLRSLNPTERRMALQDAFAVSEFGKRLLTASGNPGNEPGAGASNDSWEDPLQQDRSGKTVLLIDDIYTTGATADACSQALLEGGAAEVYLLTLASGGNRKPEITPDGE